MLELFGQPPSFLLLFAVDLFRVAASEALELFPSLLGDANFPG